MTSHKSRGTRAVQRELSLLRVGTLMLHPYDPLNVISNHTLTFSQHSEGQHPFNAIKTRHVLNPFSPVLAIVFVNIDPVVLGLDIQTGLVGTVVQSCKVVAIISKLLIQLNGT